MRKRTIDVVVVSGVFLGSEKCKAHELLAYLGSIQPKTLVLNGGLLAGTAKGLNKLPKTHYKVIEKIVALASQGTAVYVLSDENGHYLSKFSDISSCGVEFRRELVLELDHHKTWFLNGQNFDLGRGYHVILKLFGRFGYFLFSRWNSLFGHLKELFGSNKTVVSYPRCKSSRLKQFRSFAIRCAGGKGFNAVVCGYSGLAAKYFKEGKSGHVLYLNPGDWVAEMTALEYAFKRWKIYKYKTDKCSPSYTDEKLKNLDIQDIQAVADKHRKPKHDKVSKKRSGKRVS